MALGLAIARLELDLRSSTLGAGLLAVMPVAYSLKVTKVVVITGINVVHFRSDFGTPHASLFAYNLALPTIAAKYSYSPTLPVFR